MSETELMNNEAWVSMNPSSERFLLTCVSLCIQVVYMARNPKDIAVSFHHHCRISSFARYAGSFEDFVHYFLDGKGELQLI